MPRSGLPTIERAPRDCVVASRPLKPYRRAGAVAQQPSNTRHESETNAYSEVRSTAATEGLVTRRSRWRPLWPAGFSQSQVRWTTQSCQAYGQLVISLSLARATQMAELQRVHYRSAQPAEPGALIAGTRSDLRLRTDPGIAKATPRPLCRLPLGAHFYSHGI